MAVDAPGMSRQYPVLPETRDLISLALGNGKVPAGGSQAQWVLLSVELQSHNGTSVPLAAPPRASRHSPVATFWNLYPSPPVEIGSHSWCALVKVGSQKCWVTDEPSGPPRSP